MESQNEKLTAKERARKKLDEAKARLQRIEAREREEAQRLETRRKILLGAAVLHDLDQLDGLDEVTLGWIGKMRDRDRELFADMEARLDKKVREREKAQASPASPSGPSRNPYPGPGPGPGTSPPQPSSADHRPATSSGSHPTNYSGT